MNVLTVDQIIEGDIESLAFGGEGILRYRGFVVFVPFTAPGDSVICRAVQVKSSFAKGALIDIVRASPDRVSPPCPYFGTCGGCILQHLNDKAQNLYKLEAVKDALQRIGGISEVDDIDRNSSLFEFVPAGNKRAYRRHITLRLLPEEGHFKAGYIGRDGHLISVQSCTIFNDDDDIILTEIHRLVKTLSNPSDREGRLTLLKTDRNRYILFFSFESGYRPDRTEFNRLPDRFPSVAGVIVRTPEETVKIGSVYCEEESDGLKLLFSPETFIQNNREQSANIYREIISSVSESGRKHILDLYCGFGITSLMAANRGYRVTGMELNPAAIAFAENNRQVNRLENVRFIRGDVEKLLPDWFKKHQASLVIVNPPRQGLTKKVVETLLKAGPEEIIYVSCMPATLARDIKIFCKEMYEMKSCKIYDMFPQTAHVESLVRLKKKVDPKS